ncbi:MAG: hypothetical protein JJE55_02990 [Flavobacteriaceae bacterium]|nr:hypothetical protein [Flavobacteriaceae bacterium]
MKAVYPFTEERGVFRPMFPIAIQDSKTGKLLITNGLVDTGADVTVFPIVFFKALKIDIVKDSNSISKIYGVSGEATKVWEYPIDILILKDKSNEPLKRVSKIMVNCVDSMDSIILLGTNFFSPKFKITLDYSNKIILLEC